MLDKFETEKSELKRNEASALRELREEARRRGDLEDLVGRVQDSLEAAGTWEPGLVDAMVRHSDDLGDILLSESHEYGPPPY